MKKVYIVTITGQIPEEVHSVQVLNDR